MKGDISISAREAEELAVEVDKQLGLHNIEYATKRESQRLAPLTVRRLRTGIYEDLRKQMVAGGVPDA
ncbi:GH3 auxin-responsive promoter family protein, partial [Acinetobacter baumannii]